MRAPDGLEMITILMTIPTENATDAVDDFVDDDVSRPMLSIVGQ